MQRDQWTRVAVVSAFTLAAVGCRPAGSAKPQHGAPSTAAALPEALFVAAPPAGGRGVSQVKSDASATGEIVIHGRIGGRREPFVEGAAVFVLIDTSLKSCDQNPADSCTTPWDYCCEPADVLEGATATIQVVDAHGRPLRIQFDGSHGLEPLAEVTIAGDVASRDGGGSLVVNARHIYVHSDSR